MDEFPLDHLMAIPYVVVKASKVTWHAWQDLPERVAIGWRGVPHGTGPTIYVYMIPDYEMPRPMVRVYGGIWGDPAHDRLIHTVSIEPEAKP